MAIVRWYDQFKELAVIQDRMNRLIEDTFGKTRRGEGFPRGTWSPPIDIYETGDHVVVTADIPGMTKDEISIEVKDGILAIKGERKQANDDKEESHHLMECEYGFFHRSFALPVTIDQEKVSASYKNGVLEIVLPKKEEEKPKQIDVVTG